MKLHGAPFISLVDSGSAKRRRDRRLRTFWRHEHPSMKMVVATTMHHSNSYTLRCVTQVAIARGAGVVVVATSSALAIVIVQMKFASSKSMRTPILGDLAVGCPVIASSLTESVCVSILEITLQGVQTHDICERTVRVRIIVVAEKENAPRTKSSEISMSQGWQWCHTLKNILHGQWCPMEPHVGSCALSL